MEKVGLVLEGGSFRGVFTAGVLDCFLDNNISFPYVVGVSAGSGNGVNFISGQRGRTRKVIIHEDTDPYYGFGQFRESRKVIDLDKMMAYSPEPFDYENFYASSVESEFVVANCETGKSEYLKGDGTLESLLTICKASCSLPIMCEPVEINGGFYLDGSLTDSLPFERAIRKGCTKIVVIQTRTLGDDPTDYSRMRLLLDMAYRLKYPKIVDAMLARKNIYKGQEKRLRDLVRNGKAMIIRPEMMTISHFERDNSKIEEFYDHGYMVMEKHLDELRKFMGA